LTEQVKCKVDFFYNHNYNPLLTMSKIEEKGLLAESFFMQGFNCSQSVVAAFAQEIGLSQEQAIKMSAGFGAGFGRMREVCGAFSGIVFVASALFGNTDPAEKSAFYKEIQDLAESYKKENGGASIVCKELLGLKKSEGTWVAEKRTQEYYKKRPCPKLVKLAAQITQTYIEKRRAEQ